MLLALYINSMYSFALLRFILSLLKLLQLTFMLTGVALVPLVSNILADSHLLLTGAETYVSVASKQAEQTNFKGNQG